jgi:hypothetical protein
MERERGPETAGRMPDPDVQDGAHWAMLTAEEYGRQSHAEAHVQQPTPFMMMT